MNLSNDDGNFESGTAAIIPMCRTMQIIQGVLCVGPTIFAILVCFLRSSNEEFFGEASVMGMMGIAMAFVLIVAHFLIPTVIANNGIKSIQRDRFLSLEANEQDRHLLGIHQTTRIIGAALLEGGAFFNVIAFMTEGAPINLAIFCVLIILLIVDFPTLTRIRNWLEAQKMKIQMQR